MQPVADRLLDTNEHSTRVVQDATRSTVYEHLSYVLFTNSLPTTQSHRASCSPISTIPILYVNDNGLPLATHEIFNPRTLTMTVATAIFLMDAGDPPNEPFEQDGQRSEASLVINADVGAGTLVVSHHDQVYNTSINSDSVARNVCPIDCL